MRHRVFLRNNVYVRASIPTWTEPMMGHIFLSWWENSETAELQFVVNSLEYCQSFINISELTFPGNSFKNQLEVKVFQCWCFKMSSLYYFFLVHQWQYFKTCVLNWLHSIIKLLEGIECFKYSKIYTTAELVWLLFVHLFLKKISPIR